MALFETPLGKPPVAFSLKSAKAPTAVLLSPSMLFWSTPVANRGINVTKAGHGLVVIKERVVTDRRVVAGRPVAKQGERSVGDVADADGVAEKRCCSSGCISVHCFARRVPAPIPVQNWPSVRLSSENRPTPVL